MGADDGPLEVPRMIPFEPGTYRADQQRLSQVMADLSGKPVDNTVKCEFPSSEVDPRFWSIFTEQARLDRSARRGKQFRIPYEGQAPIDANIKWVTAYRECLNEVNCFEFLVTTPSAKYKFRTGEGFFQSLSSLKGARQNTQPLQVDVTHHVPGWADAVTESFEMAVPLWNQQVREWNLLVDDTKDPSDRLPPPSETTLHESRGSLRRSHAASSDPGRLEQVCVCVHHSPDRLRKSLGWAMASTFQAQRRLHYSLLQRDAFTTESAVEELDSLNAFDRVVDLLEYCFPHVLRDELHASYQHYIQQVLDDPLSRGRPGDKQPLPSTWPPPTRTLF